MYKQNFMIEKWGQVDFKVFNTKNCLNIEKHEWSRNEMEILEVVKICPLLFGESSLNYTANVYKQTTDKLM